MTLLALAGVNADYGEVSIVSGIDLDVAAQEIVTIAGTNGAGKSTIVKTVMGLVPRCSGTMTFLGADLMRQPAEDRVRLGLGYVPQIANVFSTLTILENLQVVENVTDFATRCAEMFDLFPILAERRRAKAVTLSGGERQQLALARALMPRPKLIALDEPTAALSPALVSQVFDIIAHLPKIGVAVLIVEQRALQSLAISDRGYILDSGRIVMSGTARDLLADTKMADLYLGRI
jgi:ABC-type branched-subunit amino acid transport system ATPase component